MPGYAAREELTYLVQTGLSPYEALRSGTHDAALALGKLEEFGTVAEGKRADLLLLDADPLEDVSNAGRISGVMVRGRWMTSLELKDMLERLRTSFVPSLPLRAWPLAVIAVSVVLAIRTSRKRTPS